MAHERLAPRVQQALEGVAESSTSKPAKEEEKESSTGSQINPALRGVSLKLLEKVILAFPPSSNTLDDVIFYSNV